MFIPTYNEDIFQVFGSLNFLLDFRSNVMNFVGTFRRMPGQPTNVLPRLLSDPLLAVISVSCIVLTTVCLGRKL